MMPQWDKCCRIESTTFATPFTGYRFTAGLLIWKMDMAGPNAVQSKVNEPIPTPGAVKITQDKAGQFVIHHNGPVAKIGHPPRWCKQACDG